MIRAKSGVPLKKNTPVVLDDPDMQSISAKNRKQPAGTIREMPRTLAPMALRPCLSTSLPKNCPIFLKIDILVLSTIFYHTPPRLSTGFPGFSIYSMLYFLLKRPKTFTFWCFSALLPFFVKSGRKWLGRLRGNSLSQSLTALPAPSGREPLAKPKTLYFSRKACRTAKGPISEDDFPRPGEDVAQRQKGESGIERSEMTGGVRIPPLA